MAVLGKLQKLQGIARPCKNGVVLEESFNTARESSLPLGEQPSKIRPISAWRIDHGTGFPACESVRISGNCYSEHTVGHLGFTGTSFWMDIARSIIVILLTNRIHPDRGNEKIKNFRPVLHDAVMQPLV